MHISSLSCYFQGFWPHWWSSLTEFNMSNNLEFIFVKFLASSARDAWKSWHISCYCSHAPNLDGTYAPTTWYVAGMGGGGTGWGDMLWGSSSSKSRSKRWRSHSRRNCQTVHSTFILYTYSSLCSQYFISDYRLASFHFLYFLFIPSAKLCSLVLLMQA